MIVDKYWQRSKTDCNADSVVENSPRKSRSISYKSDVVKRGIGRGNLLDQELFAKIEAPEAEAADGDKSYKQTALHGRTHGYEEGDYGGGEEYCLPR